MREQRASTLWVLSVHADRPKQLRVKPKLKVECGAWARPLMPDQTVSARALTRYCVRKSGLMTKRIIPLCCRTVFNMN